MNDPLPDGNGNIVDIFVVSTCTSESPVQVAHLEELGYRVTCFPDTSQLLESLRSGKPNLLVADSVTLGDASYDLCRTLKADPDLWIIPVLVVTGASSLADLLHVLDCNADNFISAPYDSAYLSAIIEGLLATPVERPTPDQIKTQFKIQHDGQLFVVTADRRRLLEFLLSSFEIAISRSGEILRISARNDELASALETASARVQDQDTALDTHARTIDLHEQSIRALQGDLADRHRRIQDHTDEISRLGQDLKERDARIAELEDQAAGLTSDLQGMNSRYSSETSDLKQQVASLTGCLTSTHAELDTVRKSLDGEIRQKAEVEARLREEESVRKRSEESLQDAALELEQMRSALSREKIRAESAEHEAKTVVQAKNEAEEELIRTVNEFRSAVQRQDEEILHFKEALTARDARISVLEDRAADLESEKTYAHAEMQARAESATATIGSLNARIDEITATLAGTEEELGVRNADLARIGEEKDRITQELRVLTEKLAGTDASLAEATRRHQEGIEQANGEIRDRESRIGDLKIDLSAARDECESYRHSLEKVRYELDEVSEVRADLEADLDEARARIRALEEDHRAAATAAAGAGQDVDRLTRELADTRRDLEAIRQQYQETEQTLHAERGEKERGAEALQALSRERDTALEERDDERRSRAEMAAENERLLQRIEAFGNEQQTQKAGFGERISALTSELDRSRSACRDLEQQVAAILKEKQDAEERVVALSSEIDQARTALADEWEDHMNARERLAAVMPATQPGMPAVSAVGEFDAEKARKRSLIVKGPDLPMNVGNQVHALNVFSGSPDRVSEPPRITNVEDLFEDEDAGGSTADPPVAAPSVSIVHESSDRDTWDSDDEESPAVMDTAEPGAEPADESGEEEPDEPLPPSPPMKEAEHMPAHFTFNRAQWFDLLKWSHHAGTLSQEQRMQIVRMGRLIQQGRKLTPRQEELVMEMLLQAQAQGFQLR